MSEDGLLPGDRAARVPLFATVFAEDCRRESCFHLYEASLALPMSPALLEEQIAAVVDAACRALASA